MKKSIKRTIICGITLLVIAGSLLIILKPTHSLATIGYKVNHPYNSDKYNENPSPILKDNKNKLDKDLITKENILKKVEKEQIKTEKSFIKKVELKTWQKHKDEDDPNNKDNFFQIDPNRKVYVVVTQYPDGLDTKAGFYANATLTTVYDAETGQLIKSSVTGEYQGNGLH